MIPTLVLQLLYQQRRRYMTILLVQAICFIVAGIALFFDGRIAGAAILVAGLLGLVAVL